MSDFKKMYSVLFNEITDIIEQLKKIQRETEEMYIGASDTSLKIAAAEEKKKNK